MSLSVEENSPKPAIASKKKKMETIFIGSRLVYLSVAVFLLFLQPSVAVAGEILTPPESQQVVINSGWVTFYCQTRGDKAQWNVNGEYYDAYNHTEDGIEFGQFVTYHRFDDTRNTQDNYMGLPSGLEWNMTEIHCASRIDQRVTSDNVYLIIMGGPAAPEPSLRTIDSSHLVLEWDPPFTWEEHPIEHYLLTSNSSHYYQPELRIQNGTLTRGSVEIVREQGIKECSAFQFSVRANNGIADSPEGTVIGGFPMGPNMSDVSIRESVTFSGDRPPCITLEIQLPRVCWFQEIEYTVTLTSSTAEQSDSGRQQYGRGHTLTVEFSDEDLAHRAVYTATATFQTFAENDATITTPVAVSKTFSLDTGVPPPTEPLLPSLGYSSSFTRESIIAIAVGGGGTIVVLIVLIIIALVVCSNVRRRSRFAESPSRKSDIQNKSLPMVTNPIYEGSPVYETVGLQLNSLERPRTPTTPTSTEPLLNESPYTGTTTVDPSYTTHSVQPFPTENDNYTVMLSPGRSKVATVRQDSNPAADQDVRYVPEPVSSSMIITSSDW